MSRVWPPERILILDNPAVQRSAARSKTSTAFPAAALVWVYTAPTASLDANAVKDFTMPDKLV